MGMNHLNIQECFVWFQRKTNTNVNSWTLYCSLDKWQVKTKFTSWLLSVIICSSQAWDQDTKQYQILKQWHETTLAWTRQFYLYLWIYNMSGPSNISCSVRCRTVVCLIKLGTCMVIKLIKKKLFYVSSMLILFTSCYL